MDRQVPRARSPPRQEAALARITTATDYAAFGACDFVIEAATEKEDIKRAIFRRCSRT